MKKIQYTFKDGKIVEMNDFECSSDRFSFKVNLPDCEESYEKGNGEGIFACAPLDAHEDWHKDLDSKKTGKVYFVKALNDSLYYKGLMYGDLIAIELRGENRPVAIIDELMNKYGPSDREGAMNLYWRTRRS